MRNLFERLDPRTRILAVVFSTLIVTSTPRSDLYPFAWYFPLTMVLILTSRASGVYLIWRCLAASPFILLAAGLLVFEGGLTPDGRPAGLAASVSVALKGYAAALLLSFLTATTTLSEILWAMRKLRAPDSLNLILGMMYRYTSLLSEEYGRLERARESRTVRPLGRRRFSVFGRQLGALFIRSWDRAEKVHAAMLSRGFTGVWPYIENRQFRALDVVFVMSVVLLYLTARLLPIA